MKRGIAATAALLALSFGNTASAEPKRYELDPQHSFPSFAFSHMGLSVWRGKFDRTKGTVILDRAARRGSVDIHVDPASINFGLQVMNDKARSDDFFNVAKYPHATYRGDIVFDGDTPVAVDGSITLLGVSKPLKLKIRSFKCAPNPMTRVEICGADVGATVNWGEYGMKLSQYGQGDAGLVQLDIQVEASPAK